MCTHELFTNEKKVAAVGSISLASSLKNRYIDIRPANTYMGVG